MVSHWILAQQPPAGPAPGTQEAPFWAQNGLFILMMVLLVLMYGSMFWGKRKQDKQRQQRLAELKKGDRIQTIGGILGTVVEARDSEIVVKVDEGTNTKIRFSRNAVHRVIEEEKSEK